MQGINKVLSLSVDALAATLALPVLFKYCSGHISISPCTNYHHSNQKMTVKHQLKAAHEELQKLRPELLVLQSLNCTLLTALKGEKLKVQEHHRELETEVAGHKAESLSLERNNQSLKDDIRNLELAAARHDEELRALRFSFTNKTKEARHNAWEVEDMKNSIAHNVEQKEMAEAALAPVTEEATMWRNEVQKVAEEKDELERRLKEQIDNSEELRRLRRENKHHSSNQYLIAQLRESLENAQSQEASVRQVSHHLVTSLTSISIEQYSGNLVL